MKDNILIWAVLIFGVIPANAEFFTITRNNPIEVKKSLEVANVPDIQPIIKVDSIDSVKDDEEDGDSEIYGYVRENARKRTGNKALKLKGHKKTAHVCKESKEDYENVTDNGRPELNIQNLYREIRRNGIKYPKIVLAQAIVETGWFTSSVCCNKHNLFGLTNPRTGQYYEFNHWTESVRAYYTKVQYKYKGGNYLLWLRDLPYAEAPDYIRAVISVMRCLK